MSLGQMIRPDGPPPGLPFRLRLKGGVIPIGVPSQKWYPDRSCGSQSPSPRYSYLIISVSIANFSYTIKNP